MDNDLNEPLLEIRERHTITTLTIVRLIYIYFLAIFLMIFIITCSYYFDDKCVDNDYIIKLLFSFFVYLPTLFILYVIGLLNIRIVTITFIISIINAGSLLVSYYNTVMYLVNYDESCFPIYYIIIAYAIFISVIYGLPLLIGICFILNIIVLYVLKKFDLL